MIAAYTKNPKPCDFGFFHYFFRLKNSTSRSCFLAASRLSNVPRFFRFPVLESFFSEYSRYLPDFNFRIIGTLLPPVSFVTKLLEFPCKLKPKLQVRMIRRHYESKADDFAVLISLERLYNEGITSHALRTDRFNISFS